MTLIKLLYSDAQPVGAVLSSTESLTVKSQVLLMAAKAFPGMSRLLVGWVRCSEDGRRAPMTMRNSARAQRQQAGPNVCVGEANAFQALLIPANSGLHSAPQWAPGAINIVCCCLLHVRRKPVGNSQSITPLCDTRFYLLSSQWFSHRRSSKNLCHLHKGKSSQ